MIPRARTSRCRSTTRSFASGTTEGAPRPPRARGGMRPWSASLWARARAGEGATALILSGSQRERRVAGTDRAVVSSGRCAQRARHDRDSSTPGSTSDRDASERPRPHPHGRHRAVARRARDRRRAAHRGRRAAWFGSRPRKPPRSYFGIDPTSVGADADCWPIAQNVVGPCEGGNSRSGTAQSSPCNRRRLLCRWLLRFVVAWSARAAPSLPIAGCSRDSLSRSTEQTLLADSLDQLAAVGRGERLAPEVGGANEFERAARLITRWLGVDVPPHRAARGKDFPHMQLALSRTTGVRTRGVLLDKGWQKHDDGPLLAFAMARERRAPSGRALALARRLLLARSRSTTPPSRSTTRPPPSCIRMRISSTLRCPAVR